MALFDRAPDSVSVYEVSLRDGLQNERATVPLRGKVRLIDALVQAGLRRIEITSFVSPKWIPQLADADEVAEHAKPPAGVTFSALCPNAKGLERARAAGIREIAVFLSASETHNKKNVNKTVAETLAAFEDTVGPARAAGMKVRGYVSTVWGCPYEGDVDPKKAVAIAKKLIAMGCYQVSISDTVGVGTPRQTERILELVLGELPPEQIAMHMHDTRGTALANVLVGLEMGIHDKAPGAGCPRDPRIDSAILSATAELLVQIGYSNLSLAAVAERAGTTKSALYRRWSSKAELVHEAAFPTAPTALKSPAGDIAADVRMMIAATRDVFTTPVVRAALPGLVADMTADHYLNARVMSRFTDLFTAVRVRLREAVDRGEAHPEVDPDRLIELIGGATMLRVLLRPDEKLDDAWVDQTTAIVVHGVTG